MRPTEGRRVGLSARSNHGYAGTEADFSAGAAAPMSDEFMGRRPPRFRPAQLPDDRNQKRTLRERMATIGHLGRLAAQVWRTSPALTIITIALRLVRAIQPVVALFVGKLIIDEVVRQIGQAPPGPALSDWFASGRLTHLGQYLALEFAVVVGNDL